ncbi:alpha-N-acetylgalactosamine-specific lectin-like [Glandiceps talaboti]
MNEKKTWDEAKCCCESEGGKLAQPDNGVVNQILENIVRRDYTKGNFWIGLNDKNREGNLVWTDDSRADFVNWGTTGSRNSRHRDCVRLT